MGKGSTVIVPAKTSNSPSEITIRAAKELIINTVATYYPESTTECTPDNLSMNRYLEFLDSTIAMAYSKTRYLFSTPIHDDAYKALTALKADLATKNIILTSTDDLKKIGAKPISEIHSRRAAALEELLNVPRPEYNMDHLTNIDKQAAPYFDELKPKKLTTFAKTASAEATPADQRYLDSYTSDATERKTALLKQFKLIVKQPYDMKALATIEDRTDNAFVLNIDNRETWSRDEAKHLQHLQISNEARRHDKEFLAKHPHMKPKF